MCICGCSSLHLGLGIGLRLLLESGLLGLWLGLRLGLRSEDIHQHSILLLEHQHILPMASLMCVRFFDRVSVQYTCVLCLMLTVNLTIEELLAMKQCWRNLL